jgi:hypothetical protein
MSQPKPKKYYLLNRYFKYTTGEQLLHELIVSDPDIAKGCIDDWKKYFHDFEDFTYTISLIEIIDCGFITKTTYSYEQLLQDEQTELEEKKNKKAGQKSLEYAHPSPAPNFELIALTAQGKELEKVLSRFFPNT